ncbi:MAG: alpha/beta fold hydrolase [Pseudomonadota bacterium]
MERQDRIAFHVHQDTVIGALHLPVGQGRCPAAIVGGPMTSVKEQVTGVYAAALAERGIAALALDHRHYGESGGEPRQYENCHHKIEDLRYGLDFLATHDRVDPDRIGAVGICLGAGYVLHAAAGNPRVRAAAAVVGYYRDVPAMRAADPDGFQAKVDQGIAARKHYEATGEALTIPAAALKGDAAMTLQSTYDYYATPRAGVPNYTNAFAVMSREHFLAFDVQSVAPRVTVPVAMVHSENGLSPSWARKFHAALPKAAPIHWMDGPNQTAFYDNPRLVRQAIDVVEAHLQGSF